MFSPGRPSIAWRQDRVRFWEAIAAGAKTREAAVAAGISEPVAHRWFKHAGGVNPRLAPTTSGRYLSSAEREDIALWRAQEVGVREIAKRLGRSPSTISRELRRNASTRTYRLEYKASTAQWHAERRAKRPKTAKLVTHHQLRQYVQDKLSGEIVTAEGEIVGPTGRSGVERTNLTAGTGSGSPAGALSRSLGACPWTSLRMSRCGSPMRRSTRRSTLRAVAGLSASSPGTCAEAGPNGRREREPANKPGRT